MRKWRKRATVTVILLSGLLMLLLIIIRPQIQRTVTEGHRLHNVRLIWANMRYERRIKLIREELDCVQSKQYTALFLSMYPITTYNMELLSHWRGLEPFKMEMVMENGRELAGTLAYLQELGNWPDTVLLGLDPECLEAEYPLADSLLQAIRQTPDTVWEILVVNPSLTYWQKKGDGEWPAVIDQYEEAAKQLVQEENVKLFYAGDREWLVCNGSNYAEEKMPAENVARVLLANYTSDRYRLTEENLEECMASTRELIGKWRSDDRKLTGLQDKTLVFIGDSTFGNFTDSLAITGVVEEFTDARVVNCGYGGMTGAHGEAAGVTLGELLDAIETGDSSRIEEGESRPPAVAVSAKLRQDAGSGKNVIFFLDFGINDYIGAIPASGEDPYDSWTYMGAMRTGIERLQDMFAEGEIVLVTPNFIKYNNYGTNPVGEAENVYTDYVDAVRALAGEYTLPVLDFYEDIGINQDNWTKCLQDEVHPNEMSRFRMGMGVLDLLRQMFY